MNSFKKISIRILIIFYGFSYLLQNTAFIDWKKVYAAENPSTTNIVAVFVDKNIYQGIENNLERYTKEYIQGKIANSKAVVFPIDTTTLKAHEISQILENMYFEGIKDESSKLIGVVLMGDIPLPVVQNNGFIYPSIYPYVDFEDQQFVYDTNKKFFVSNNNPNGQAELRHGIIKFDTASEYNSFFEKVRNYKENPTTFIDKAIRYDDFIGLKKYFIPENTKYYINKMIFGEDIGYHRYTSLLLDTLKNEHNVETLALGNTLSSDIEGSEDQDIQDYGDMIKSRNDEAESVTSQITATMPTLTLKKSTDEMLKSYDGLIGSTFLSKIKNNVASLARRYKNTEGETFDDINGNTDKIDQQDNRVAGDSDNNIQGLLIQINDYLESGLNAKIDEEKYYLTIPVPESYLQVQGDKKKGKCVRPTYNYYKNYYFGRTTTALQNAGDTSIYKGTYQNLTTLSGANIINTGKSIGGSYKVFSTQVEANRGYNINNATDELERYNKYKINRQDLRGMQCVKYLFSWEWLNICIKKRVWKADTSSDEKKCNINDTEQQGGCESMTGFGQRNRGGASPFNLNTTDGTLKYQYTGAKLPIYDIAGSKKISTPEADANSYSGVMKYAALIQEKFGAGDLQKNNSLSYLINFPYVQGNDLLFTNQYPQGNLKDPRRRSINPPKTYAQTSYFSIFDATQYHTKVGGKAVLYNRTNATDSKGCNVEGNIYTYRTLDSRVKNIAPTRDQISDTEFLKFKNDSELEKFYKNVMTDLSGTKTDIAQKTIVFSGTSNNDMTGVISNLSNIKQKISTYNTVIQDMITFIPTIGMSSSTVANKVNDWTGGINSTRLGDLRFRIGKTAEGMDILLNYISTLSINNVGLSFENIITSENYKNQKVEILNTWKADFTNNFNGIINNMNTLKSTFVQARSTYNTIANFNNSTAIRTALGAKRVAIDAIAICGTTPCGCDANHYKPLCDLLSNTISTLQNDQSNTGLNDRIDDIQSYENGETSESGGPIIIQPFIQINQEFTENGIGNEILSLKTIMNTFDVSSDANKKETIKGMNLTTSDRPIDNIRNITFKGIGGDTIRLNYPNLYEVNVYKEVGDKLILKKPVEIRAAIKTYLISKVTEYNTLLQAQKNKQLTYYNANSNKFNLLGQIDPLANPMNVVHNYDLLPTNYFIDQMVNFLDTLKANNSKAAIFGKNDADTTDEKLDMIANFLYQQNIARPERFKQNSVLDDISEIKASFDINHKISNVVSTYLTEDNDQGKFLTPTYNITGYEIGFINSDGTDYVSTNQLPSFIKTIQQSQANTPTPNNAFIEDATQTNDLQKDVDTCEGVDTDGSSLLFDLKTFKSPRAKAMKCRAKKIFTKPFSIDISFKNALGPTVLGTFNEIKNTFENAGEEWKEYGNQRSTKNNDDLINQAPTNIKQNLQGYNTYGIVKLSNKTINVTDTGSNALTIGMTQDVGNIMLKISGTGDNCFGITKANGAVLSNNVCTEAAEQLYNPYTDPETFLVYKNQKAGSTSLQIQLCVPIATKEYCITKPQVINVLPGPVATIKLDSTTNIIMGGGEMPLAIHAEDAYGNTVGQTVESYTISVPEGQGTISDGSSSNSSIQFDNFSKTSFIYQAPTGLNIGTTITITPTTTTTKLLAIQPSTAIKAAQKKIIVAQGRVTVANNQGTFYKTNNQQNIQTKLKFTLPKNESDLQYQDSDGIQQIKTENVPSLHITVVDKNGNKLNTVVNISSEKGLLTPGITRESNITKGTISKKQKTFSLSNDFIVEDGNLDIALYPSFKAGDDKITINIPGIDPIIIPVQVQAGTAKKVVLTLNKSRMDFTTTKSSTGTIQVVDTWNNKVTTGTKIKIGVIGSATINTNEIIYSGNEYTYKVTATGAGGEGYIFGYIDTDTRALADQVPAYQKFIIQESILPKEKLNVMYLNLFGTDRGNQRGYFSENNKVVNSMTTKSNKLLATTTELVDPSKIKQIEYIISPSGQIQSISNKEFGLTIDDNHIVVRLPEVANINLGVTNGYKIQVTDTGAIEKFEKTANTMFYIPEPTDSVITGNEATKTKITINGKDIFDIMAGKIDPMLTITTDGETLADMSTYTMVFNDKTIGKLLIWNTTNITANTTAIDLQDPITYGKTPIFTEGSTNTQGIGIYLTASAYTKQGYKSIEDSSDAMLGIGFTSDFKNISNFANGKIVGEATIPYGSQFLINFGDPLLERRDKNPEIPDTDFDASIGQTIYADPNKSIYKTLPIDFNNDGLKDILIVYTDGTVKLLKNYGGTEGYKNLQELMIIAEAIKEIHVGDIDGNGYEDIIIITTNNKGIVYLNNKGIFAVDGKNICLNTNAEPDMKTTKPDDFSNIDQLFVVDADQDGKMDILTNDTLGDIKIFYGGSTSKGANYLSSITGTCDANRYERQKGTYKTVKRLAIKINSSRYIQDQSLIHRKGEAAPVEGTEEEVPEQEIDTSNYTKEQLLEAAKNFTANLNGYVTAGAKQLAYTENPLDTTPIYENIAADEVYYLPINESNDVVSVYKEYNDMNGGVLRKGDSVVIQTTILSKKANNKLTYIDILKGPRAIAKDSDKKITSLLFTTTNTGSLNIDWNVPEEYQFALDNIRLNSGEKLTFSYMTKYEQENPITKISVEDQDLTQENKEKDGYVDIAINSTDACQKGKQILFNKNTGNKRTYEEIFQDIQAEIDDYNSGAQNTTTTATDAILDQIGNISSLDDLSSIQGVSETLESWKPIGLLTPITSLTGFFNLVANQGGGININTNFIDAAMGKVSKKLDSALQGLCQGFKIGKGGCQGVPVPFNQAFLAPGTYHLFGCVPKAPNPLYIPFKLLNQTLGKGLPVISFPTNSVIPIWPPTPAGAGGIFGGQGSQFRLYIAPTLTLGLGMAMCFGPYSVGTNIPKPFSDLGGNCIVFALPPLTKCSSATTNTTTAGPSAEAQNPNFESTVGTCNNPPKQNNTIVFDEEDNETKIVTTASSSLQMVAAGSEENNPQYSAAIPQGNFGGLVSIDQEPITTTSVAGETNLYDGYELQKGNKINNKIVGAKTKGLVKCVVQDWTTRQIQYIQNNLTKMTIQIDLPDMTTMFEGFDKIGNISDTYKEINRQDQAEGYIQDTTGKGIGKGTGANRTDKLSKQQLNNISQQIGNNPFEAIQQVFNEVPLVNIDSKEINIKIPTLTSDDIIKYQNYLKLWIEENGKTLEDRTDMLNQMLAMCGTTDKADAQQEKDKLTTQLATITDNDIKSELQSEIDEMQKIINLPQTTTRKKMGSDIKNIGINMTNTAKKVATLPVWLGIQAKLSIQKQKQGKNFKNQALLDFADVKVTNLQKCSGIAGSMDTFLSFRENTAGLISSVKANINVLEEYKKFPTQLYEWTHLTDRYLTELSDILSEFVESTTYRLNTNANRFSQYVDAITILVGTIKTWQAIIDFSVNRSEKCSKCSNDNYGAFSCSLSFLCPKLPIFPIPAFKIPNIYMDMSHMELGMNIILPKINFVPIKIALPQLPKLPEPPSVEVNRDVLWGLDVGFAANLSVPTIPVIPEPPTLPEPPSFLPSVNIDLPVLPPAPKIPKIMPEITAILNVAEFIGKVFCIVKGGIGLVGEKSVKGKIEQITQRTWNVPVFDYFNMTTKFKDPPLQGFDYKMDAYTTLKFNFDGVYDVFNNIASLTNEVVSKTIEAPMNKAIQQVTNAANNNRLTDTGFETIENLNQNINLNGYLPKDSQQEESGMIDYNIAYTQLKQGLMKFENSSATDKAMNTKVKTILATIENKSTVLPATKQIHQAEEAAQGMIDKKIKENQTIQKEIREYDKFIKKMKENEVVLVSDTKESASFTTPLLTIDAPTKNILQSQEDPTKTYLTLNQSMVNGYLKAINTDGAEKLNMSESTYKKSKKYLETTKEKIDGALVAYADTQTLAQSTCTDCATTSEGSKYSADVSAYVNGVFVDTYSGTEKSIINTVAATDQIEKVQETYLTTDLNNDEKDDIFMYDTNAIYIKYGQQETENLSKGGNSLTTYYDEFYSYANEHPGNRFNTSKRYISSLDQLRKNSDAYGYTQINGITIKVVDTNKEVKNMKTDGQTFDSLKISWTNSKTKGENVDGYIIKVSDKIDEKDTPKSFWDIFTTKSKPKYILLLPENTEYTKGLLTIDDDTEKSPINLEIGDKILAVDYYDPDLETISVTLQDLPRKWLYTSLATLTISQDELTSSQQKTFTLYKKTSPRSNQTVAGLQNLGDVSAPVGEVSLWRNTTNETISTGVVHDGYINTNYTLKSSWKDDVVVSKMVIQKDGVTIKEINNQAQTGSIDLAGLFFTGETQQSYDFIAIDQNNNIAKETVVVNIHIPGIEVIDLKKSGTETADIIAQISNDLDEGTIIFQRLRNGIRKDMQGSNQNTYGGFDLTPGQTIITGGIFTIGNDIGLYDTQGNEIATIDPKTGEIKINQGFTNKIAIQLSFSSHIPVIELRDTVKNITLFQVVLPVESITDIEMNQGKPNYEQLLLQNQQFGDFNNGYCIKNNKNDCIIYTNNAGAIYIPGIYANSLIGEYMFDTAQKKAKYIIKDQANKTISTMTLQVKTNK